MLTAGGTCFRASNDLAGAKTGAGGIDADDGCGKGASVRLLPDVCLKHCKLDNF